MKHTAASLEAGAWMAHCGRIAAFVDGEAWEGL
jgi:hypothetical protein